MDTPILPEVVAETVVQEVEHYLGKPLPETSVKALVDQQARLYACSADWRKKMQATGNRGRDTLFAFMRHWLTSDLKKADPALHSRLPQSFWMGQELPSPHSR